MPVADAGLDTKENQLLYSCSSFVLQTRVVGPKETAIPTKEERINKLMEYAKMAKLIQ